MSSVTRSRFWIRSRLAVSHSTDRVQFKLSDRQRYGTQWTCNRGKRVPLPLANSDAVTVALRAKAKLGSLRENAEQIDTLYGPCPPAAQVRGKTTPTRTFARSYSIPNFERSFFPALTGLGE